MDAATTIEMPLIDAQFVDRFLAGKASEAETRQLINGDPEIAAFTLLAIQKRIAAGTSTGANTPSAAIPPYAKAQSKPSKAKSKRGGQNGHPGRRRHTPPKPDRTREHRATECPDCGTKLRDTGEVRDRYSEDIPEDLKPVITRDVIHRDDCPACKKRVEPKLSDVLPRCTLGNRTLVLSALLHFLQGLTISQIVDTFNFHLRLKVTPGGLVQMWPAVMIRKNSYANQSDRGALTQSVLMTVLRTLRLRGLQPIDTILAALVDYSRTGKLPSMPSEG